MPLYLSLWEGLVMTVDWYGLSMLLLFAAHQHMLEIMRKELGDETGQTITKVQNRLRNFSTDKAAVGRAVGGHDRDA